MRTDSKQALLVISFYFPPYPRVGGRRWAKHAKYLNRLDIDTWVLTGDFPGSGSPWDDDIREYSEKIIRLPLTSPYKPYFETTLPVGFFDKLRWKISYLRWQQRKKNLKGNYNDISRPNTSRFLEAARRIVKEKQIDTVILSVGPFAYSEVLLRLKEEFPHLTYVVDYRDPWEEAISGLTPAQQQQELQQQNQLLRCVDLVLTVNDDISQKIRRLAGGTPVITLPHSVDEDFLAIAEQPSKAGEGPLKIIYGGELYGGMEEQMRTFTDFFDQLSKTAGQVVEAAFHSPYPSYETILAGRVKLGSMLLKKEYQQTLMSSDLILLFKSPLSSEAFFSSKFYEIICLRKPILFFGLSGSVSEFIEKHQLGYHVRPDNVKEICEQVLANRHNGKVPNRSYDPGQHSFESNTRFLIAELNQLAHAV